MTTKKGETSNYQAYVTIIDGKTVLIDPMGYALIQAVNKINCENTYISQIDRIEHLKNRITEKELDPKTVVIVIINVDSPYGPEIAEALMPGHDWQQYRDRGEIPFAKGLAIKERMTEMIATFDKGASEKMTSMKEIPVMVIDHGVVEIFPIDFSSVAKTTAQQMKEIETSFPDFQKAKDWAEKNGAIEITQSKGRLISSFKFPDQSEVYFDPAFGKDHIIVVIEHSNN